MYVYDGGIIIDNCGTLKSVKDEIGNIAYEEVLDLWGKGSEDDFRKILKQVYLGFDKIYETHWVSSFAEALFATSDLARSLKEDNMYGIFVGLVPFGYRDSTLLPVYFIFRCSNNGRSVIVSEVALDDNY